MWETLDSWRGALVAGDVALAASAGEEGVRQRQAQRLRLLLATAARSSPLYRGLLRGHDPAGARLQDLPIVGKAELMGRFDEWVADPALKLDELRRFVADPSRIGQAYLERYVVWTSSGSSGQPGVFVQDAGAMAVYDALEALRRPSTRPWTRLMDPMFAMERIAFVGALGGHFASVVSNERLRRLNPALARSLHDISFLQPIEVLVDELQGVDPTILGTYPSAALMLAQEQAAGRLAIAPKEVWTGGETLTAATRRFISGVFGCPVVDSYGASEFFTLACECRCARLHLNSDWVILEPVDHEGRAVAPGEFGTTVLLTNLANHVQPLIRYDLGDRVRLLPDSCECGSAFPCIEVQGRHDDILLLATARGTRMPVLPLALSTVLEDEGGLFDFQLEQCGLGTLRLHSPLRGHEAVLAMRRGRDALAAFLTAQGAAPVEIHTRTGTAHRRGPGGKVRRVLADPAVRAQE
jgi:phenylacetate-coenzyme A ligase PaaK-like adenylate-forming protein